MTIIDASDLLIYLGRASTVTAAQRALMELVIPLADSAVKNYLRYNVVQATYTHLLPNINAYGQGSGYVDVVNNRISMDGWSDTQILELPEIPVRSVTSVYSDMSAMGGQGPNDFAANTLLQLGTDYYLDVDESGVCWSGHIRRWYTTWPARARAVKVTYVAGFTRDELDGNTQIGKRNPANIKLAAILTAAAMYQQAINWRQANNPGGIESERLGDYAVNYGNLPSFMTAETQQALPPLAMAYLQPFVRLMR